MGLFPAMNVADGKCAAFPDVCKIPPSVPVPFPNTANPADGNGTPHVKIMGSNALRFGDKLSRSAGDEAGTAGGGVKSRKIKGTVTILSGSPTVHADGKPLAYVTVPTSHNDGNAAGAFTSAGQQKVMVRGPAVSWLAMLLAEAGRAVRLYLQGKPLKPDDVKKMVEKHRMSNRFTTDQYLCWMHKESGLMPFAGAPGSSARGLTQILEGTAGDIDTRLGFNPDPDIPLYDQLFDPEVAILAGMLYLDDRASLFPEGQGFAGYHGSDPRPAQPRRREGETQQQFDARMEEYRRRLADYQAYEREQGGRLNAIANYAPNQAYQNAINNCASCLQGGGAQADCLKKANG